MLNSESRPVKPAAIAAIATRWSDVSALNLIGASVMNQPPDSYEPIGIFNFAIAKNYSDSNHCVRLIFLEKS
jgi:hypothetical protein